MPDVLLGSFDVTASFTDDYVYSEADLTPSTGARLCTSGTRPMLITALRGRVSGRGGTRSVEMYLGSSQITMSRSSAGSAQDTGWQDSSNWLTHYGSTPNYGYRDMSGSCYFGRDNTGFAQGAFGTFGGDIGMYYRYIQAPSAPHLTVTPTGPETALVEWDGPSDTGGGSISAYTLQRALDDGFTTGLTTVTVGGTSGGGYAVVTGLVGGTEYRYRVAAKNAAIIAEGALGGTWSSTKKQAQPGATGGAGKIFIGGAWVDAGAKIYVGGSWVDAAGKIFIGGSWVDF